MRLLVKSPLKTFVIGLLTPATVSHLFEKRYKLQDLQRLGASTCQFQSKTYSDARKNRNDLEIRSEEWIDGFRYIRPPNRRKSSQAKGKS